MNFYLFPATTLLRPYPLFAGLEKSVKVWAVRGCYIQGASASLKRSLMKMLTLNFDRLSVTKPKKILNGIRSETNIF